MSAQVECNHKMNRTQADDNEKQKMFRKNNNLLHRIFWRHISVVFRPTCSIKQVWMYYRSGTVDRIASMQPVDCSRSSGRWAKAACALTRRQHFSVWNDIMPNYIPIQFEITVLGLFCKMTTWLPPWKYDVISEIWLLHPMHIYLKNNREMTQP